MQSLQAHNNMLLGQVQSKDQQLAHAAQRLADAASDKAVAQAKVEELERKLQAVEHRLEEVALEAMRHRRTAQEAATKEQNWKTQLDEQLIVSGEQEVVRQALQEQVKVMSQQVESQNTKLADAYNKLSLMAQCVHADDVQC